MTPGDFDIDLDPMLFMQAVVDEQLEVLDFAKAGGMDFGREGLEHLSAGVADIARMQLERAQLTLDTLIAEDGTWSSSEACEMVLDGTDTDGSEWYRCTVHGRMVLGDIYVCEGYQPPPYIDPTK